MSGQGLGGASAESACAKSPHLQFSPCASCLFTSLSPEKPNTSSNSPPPLPRKCSTRPNAERDAEPVRDKERGARSPRKSPVMTRHVRRASITSPIHLQHLTLHPIPIESLPAADSAEHAARTLEIVAEAKLLIASPLWLPPKTYYDGLITTSSLAPEATTTGPVAEGAEPPDPDSGKSRRLSVWGGGKKAVREITEGISWHLRSVRLTDEWAHVYPGIHYEQFWSALAERHFEQEVRADGPGANPLLMTLYC